MKAKVFILLAVLAILMLPSCNEGIEPVMPISEDSMLTRSSDNTEDEGRFENEPFKWDYSFSTDSCLEDNRVLVYPLETSEANDSTFNSNRRIRPTTRPGSGGGGEHRTGSSTTTDQMLIVDPNIVYVGAAFPESTFAKDYSKELLYPRNPIDKIGRAHV